MKTTTMKTGIFLSIILLCGLNVFAQEGFYVKIQDNDLPESISKKKDQTLDIKFTSQDVDEIFKKYKLYKFEKAFKRSKNPYLIDVYLVKPDDIMLVDELTRKFPEIFKGIEYYYDPIYTYAPNDFALETSGQTGLELIRAKDAWEISKGSSDIIIGINDTYIDEDHEDLEDNIYDVLSNGSSTGDYAYHGSIVSFCASGVTDNNTGLSSIGFNSSLMFEAGGSISDLYDLAYEGAQIVNASYKTGCTFNSYHQAAIDDIHDMGVIIVAGAGNGPGGTSCGTGHDLLYPASYNHVISVTSVAHLFEYGSIDPTYGAYAWADCHEDSINNPNTLHTHNDSVDICAPGYHVSSAKMNDDYGAAWGTSFASPIVAGVCGLILAENPDLDPDEVESILKTTAFDITTISENAKFDGLLGAGRINAYAAVNAARELNCNYATLPYSTGFESGLDDNWTMYESHRYGRCVRSSDHSPNTGSYHLTMDVIENNNYNTNEAWMHLNLSGKTNVELNFWWKETSDETHSTDGVYISDDGGDSFTKIYSLTGGSSSYTKVTIALSDEISDASLAHSSTFVVKFQQYDNYTMTTDGIAIDDIDVCAPLPAPTTIYTPPPYHCTWDWGTYSCSVVTGADEYDWESPPGQNEAIIDEDGTRFVEVKGYEEGWYDLRVRVKNSCGEYGDWKTTSIWIDECGKSTPITDDSFTLHPNPANDIVIISLNEEKLSQTEPNQGFKVDIYNQIGNLILSDRSYENSLTLSVDHLLNGTYFFKIEYNKALYTYEVIVNH